MTLTENPMTPPAELAPHVITTDDFVARYDAVIRHPRMQALYGNSGFFNVGYWIDDISEQAAACNRLVDEIATRIPDNARVILDVGCGLGAGTRRLADRFGRSRVVGCNISSWQLAEARRRGLAETVEMDAADMPFATGSADAVVAMESAQHFDTRERFLHEAWRVLRPGGVIILADMLFADREAIGGWMLPAANYLPDCDSYLDLLRAAGFTNVEVRDVTRVTWAPHCAMMRVVSPQHEEQIDRFERSLSAYVFAFGQKS